MSIGLNRQIRGFVRGGGKSGYGYGVTAASEYPRCRTQDDGTDQALLEISASSDWTMQFVVESIGSSGANAGFFRCSAAGTGGTWFLQDGSTRRPWVRVNSTDILRPGSGAQWTTGQKLNAIVRFRNASQIEVWWDGRLQHSASHSTSQDALTVASGNAIYAFAVQGQGGGGAETTTGNWLGYRAWSRYLDDQEMHALARDELALYEPRRIWVPVSAGGAADLTLADASHAHAADSLSLTTASTLTIADATHAHTAEALSLTTASTLAVADALHDHAAEGLALTTESLLALQDALHDHAADAPELLSGSSLLIAEALQAHTADGLALVVDAYLTVANAGHGHTADALVLTVPSTGADPAAVWSYVLSNGKTAEENVVEILAKLQALHDIHGLTLGSPLTVSATARAAGTISQTISSSSGTTTVTRTS